MLNLTTTLAAELGNNTSANSAYNQTNFGANFSNVTTVTQSLQTISANPNIQDASLNPITPAHVSSQSVKTLIPSYTGKWYAHITPWFRSGGGGGHIDIGVNNDSVGWVTAAMTDIAGRGFDGITIDWYGLGSYENTVTLLIQTYLAAHPVLTYAIMIDAQSYTNTSELESELSYIESTYFFDAAYQKQGGKPVVLFFNTVGGVNYATAKASVGTSMYWIFQGPSGLSNAYVDGCFDWVQPWHNGVVGGDSYNAAATNSYLTQVHNSAKGSMPCIAPGFNGTLTADLAWSLGKYLPRNNGDCWLSQAYTVAANLPINIIGMQVATWNDWEEGTAIETPIDNGVSVVASITNNTLSWSLSGNTEGVSAIRLLASPDSTNAAVLGNLSTSSTSFNLNSISGWGTDTYQVYVIAMGRAAFRAHSTSVSYVNSSVVPPPTPNMVRLMGGSFQDAKGNPLNHGKVLFSLNVDGRISPNNGQVVSSIKTLIKLDSQGDAFGTNTVIVSSTSVLENILTVNSTVDITDLVEVGDKIVFPSGMVANWLNEQIVEVLSIDLNGLFFTAVFNNTDYTTLFEPSRSYTVGEPQFIWPNDVLIPTNTFYTVNVYTNSGQPAWGPYYGTVDSPTLFNMDSWIPSKIGT